MKLIQDTWDMKFGNIDITICLQLQKSILHIPSHENVPSWSDECFQNGDISIKATYYGGNLGL